MVFLAKTGQSILSSKSAFFYTKNWIITLHVLASYDVRHTIYSKPTTLPQQLQKASKEFQEIFEGSSTRNNHNPRGFQLLEKVPRTKFWNLFK